MKKMVTKKRVTKCLGSVILLACVLTVTDSACNCKDGCASDDGMCQECVDGFYGNRCQSSCSHFCKPLNGVVACDKDSGQCLNGCIDWYYGDTCEFICPHECKRCTSDTSCLICEHNNQWGNRCEKPCPLQCESQECNINGVCDRCVTGSDGQYYYGDQCNQECSEAIPDCKQCTRDGQKCLVCQSAKFGERCDMTCPDHCMECSSALNCSRCEPGYTGGVCDQLCPVGCKECDIQISCLQCEDGRFGVNCASQCNQFCLDRFGQRACDKMDGVCYSCVEGFFGTHCESNCSSNCEGGCDKTNGECDHCPYGFYGKDRCDMKCPLNCDFGCSKVNGECRLCKAGFYGERCEQHCNKNCQVETWNQFGCAKVNGYCKRCPDGYYGNYCEKACSTNCYSWEEGRLGHCDRLTGRCYSGCKDGWFNETCQNSCGENCLKRKCNRVDGMCTLRCEDGWFGENCRSTCGNCLETRCNRDNGTCTEGCKDGWFGDICLSKCSETCLEGRCNREDGMCTFGCEDGWFGEKCQSNCGNCVERRCNWKDGICTEGCMNGWFGEKCQSNCGNCVERRCNWKDGICTEGCMDGWFGEKCQSNCGNCVERRCNWKDGTCTKGCMDGWFNETCQTNCSKNCLENRCNQKDGMCTLGCKDGWFGETCQSNCRENCINRRCNQPDGMCTIGCVPGFIGDGCQEEQKAVVMGESEIGISGLVAYISLGCLTVLVITASIYLFKIVRKRRRQAGTVESSTGGRQELPLLTPRSAEEGRSNHTLFANANAVVVNVQEDSSDPNTEVVADLQLYKDRLLSDGRGTPVYEGVFEDSIPVAVKKIHLTVPQYAEELLEHVKILREVETLRKLPGHNHKNIVRYLKSVKTPHFLYIAFELCQGTLEDYVDPQKSWSEELPWKDALTQMAKGLQFLHITVNMAHRDLKPSNVLLYKSTLDTKVVLADFGQSKMMANMQCSMTGATGSLGWIAPEAEKTQGYYYTDSDIFSLGCLFYFVATKGNHPFGEYPLERQTNISQNKSDLSILQPYLECLRGLITDMIQVNHDDRPSAELVSEHPSLMADDVIMDFLHKASNKINGYPLSQQNILEHPTIIPGGSWTQLLPANSQAHLSTYTLPRHKQPMFKGREGSVRHLLRAIRNCSEHFPDLPAAVRAEMGASTPDHVQFWLGQYPWLLTHVYSNMKSDKSLMDSIRKA